MSPSRRGGRAGRRVQRGRLAAQPPAAVERYDPYLAIQRALSPGLRERAEERMIAMNPRLRGAHLADMLDMLDNHDAFVALSEPYWEQIGARLSAQLGPHGHETLSSALDCAILCLGFTGPRWVTPDYGSPEIDYAGDPAWTLAAFTELLARAAVAGETATITDRTELEHPDDAYSRQPFCDDCTHPLAEHDPDTGGCLNINAHFGPCPCAHTPPAQLEVLTLQFNADRAG